MFFPFSVTPIYLAQDMLILSTTTFETIIYRRTNVGLFRERTFSVPIFPIYSYFHGDIVFEMDWKVGRTVRVQLFSKRKGELIPDVEKVFEFPTDSFWVFVGPNQLRVLPVSGRDIWFILPYPDDLEIEHLKIPDVISNVDDAFLFERNKILFIVRGNRLSAVMYDLDKDKTELIAKDFARYKTIAIGEKGVLLVTDSKIIHIDTFGNVKQEAYLDPIYGEDGKSPLPITGAGNEFIAAIVRGNILSLVELDNLSVKNIAFETPIEDIAINQQKREVAISLKLPEGNDVLIREF